MVVQVFGLGVMITDYSRVDVGYVFGVIVFVELRIGKYKGKCIDVAWFGRSNFRQLIACAFERGECRRVHSDCHVICIRLDHDVYQSTVQVHLRIHFDELRLGYYLAE